MIFMIEKYEPKPPKRVKGRILNILLSVLAAGMWLGKDYFAIPDKTLMFVTVLLFGVLFFSAKNSKMAMENYQTAKTLKEMREEKKPDDFYKESFYD